MAVVKRLLLILLLLWPALAGAATTYYTKGSCANDGNGLSASCASSPGGAGATNSISSGISKLSSGDDILNIEAGTYHVDEIRVQGKNGTSGHPIIIQNNGYTGTLGSGDQTIIDGSSSVTWTQCSWNGTTCDCGPAHLGIQIGGGGSTACTETWYYIGGGVGQVDASLACVKTDGTPCMRVGSSGHTTIDSTSLALMTNSTSGYVSTVCGTHSWIKCNSSSDCPSAGETCTTKTTEVDSVSDEQKNFQCAGAGNPVACCTGVGTGNCAILARWGSNSRGNVTFDNNGDSFWFCNSNYFTVQGLNFRNFRRSHLLVTDNGNGGCSGVSDHVTVTNNTFAYGQDTGGSDYQIDFHNATVAGPITGNYFAHSGSESIHVDPHSTGATVMTIQGNFFFDNGDPGVLGARGAFPLSGTPECMTLTDNSGTGGDYTGSDVSNNYCYKAHKNGVILENIHSNDKVHDNIFNHVGRTAIKLAGDTAGVSSNQIYNNLIISPCQANVGDAGIWVEASGGTADSNLIYNNTVVIDPIITCSALTDSGSTRPTNTVVRNNIFSLSGSLKLIDWSASGTFTNNLVYSSTIGSGTLIGWNGSNYTCSTITSLDAASKCSDPLYIGPTGNNFHIQGPLAPASPAMDAGTATGMPAARTTDINNTIANLHGLPVYSDANPIQNAIWDIGIDEVVQVSAGTTILDISAADAPDPVTSGGNITYTLTYHNTGSAQATNTIIADFVPQGTTYVSCTGPCAYFPNGGNGPPGSVAWGIGTVAAGGNGSVTFTVLVPASTGSGTVIHNDLYAIISDQTGQILGSNPDTTTVSNIATRRGRIFPHGAR